MKESEELLKAARCQGNDYKALSLMCKAMRAERSEKFTQDWLPVFQSKYPVKKRPDGSYSIATKDYGTVDYFPKANKVLIRKLNKWVKPGLRWMVRNLTP